MDSPSVGVLNGHPLGHPLLTHLESPLFGVIHGHESVVKATRPTKTAPGFIVPSPEGAGHFHIRRCTPESDRPKSRSGIGSTGQAGGPFVPPKALTDLRSPSICLISDSKKGNLITRSNPRKKQDPFPSGCNAHDTCAQDRGGTVTCRSCPSQQR